MPRVTHVKKARKDNPVAKKGESYYWWKFRYGGKSYSLTRPRASQLTQSAYFGTIYSTQEMIEDWNGTDATEFDELKEEVRGEIDSLRDETQESLDNMPDSLQYSPTGELLQERVDALENAEMELDSIDEFEFNREDFDEEEYETEEELEADRDEHEKQEDERFESEYDSWLDEAKSQLTEALDSAIV